MQAGDGSQRKPVPNPLAVAVPNNCLKKVPAALNLTTSSLLSWPSSSSYVKSMLSFQTEAPPAAEDTINGPALPSRPCCACKKAWQPLLRPGVSCTHTLIPRLKLSHQKQLVSQVQFYFEHFQTAYQDVITQDVTMPLDSSKHPSPTSIKRVADPSNLN